MIIYFQKDWYNVNWSNKRECLKLKKARIKWYPKETITIVDNADDLMLLTNTPSQAKSLLHNLEKTNTANKTNKQIKQGSSVLNETVESPH